MKIYNFSAGPAMLPSEVLEQAQAELRDWQSTGTSVMEVSHRGKEFDACAIEAAQNLRALLNIPNNYKILFLQGGARAQFAAVPLNILADKTSADYINSGYWSQSAADEADKYCQTRRLNIQTNKEGKLGLIPPSKWELSDKAAYIHYCPNETIEGVAIDEDPNFGDKIVVADYSSSILSKPIDVARYGIIYAGAQKNIGPAGITVVIVREDLLGRAQKSLPSVLNYQVQAQHDSMFNTPPTFAWYLSGLVFKWIQRLGGLTAMEKRNREKAKSLYDYIDRSGFYQNPVVDVNRSIMNVPFFTSNKELDTLFVKEAADAGIIGIKGHRISGGMRASIYNAMEMEGVSYLINFMENFSNKHG